MLLQSAEEIVLLITALDKAGVFVPALFMDVAVLFKVRAGGESFVTIPAAIRS